MTGDPTTIKHYTHLPMCGFCVNAWDVIYGRVRTLISCEQWIGYCKWGGCDPDVWEYIDEITGWPIGMKLNKQGKPKAFYDHKIVIEIPPFDNRVYHRRSDSGDNAPWRKVSVQLMKAWQERTAKIKGIKIEDVEWEDSIYPDPNYTEPVQTKVVDLDDPDLW
jgi:hypothetical protein